MKITALRINRLINQNSLYVLVNISVSAVGFLRAFLFMKWLNMGDLGIVSLVQTVIMFLGLFQLGLLNGGYRIFALDRVEQQRDINNILFSYFGVLISLAVLFWCVLVISGIQIILSNALMAVALMCGILTLVMNWLTNTLIGKRLLKNINQINSIAVLVSLALLPLVVVWGVAGAVASLVAQPLVFIVITLIRHKELRPTAWNFNLKLIRYILSFGFIPFLAGIFTVINLQVERWSIAEILGTEALGKFYLVFLYSTLFVLVPTSLLNVFFPKAIYTYENNEMLQFRSILKKHLIVLCGYLIIIVFFTLVGLQFFVDLLLPQHSANTIYVYCFLPGLLALVLCDPIAVILNSTVRLKPILYAGVIGMLLNVILIVLANKLQMFDLTNLTWIKVMVNSSPFFVYCFYVIINYKSIFRIKSQ